MPSHKITLTQILEFLEVPRPTVYSWLKMGLLPGKEFTESNRGKVMTFSFEDTVALRIGQQVLNTFKDVAIAKKAITAYWDFRKHKDFAKFPHMAFTTFSDGPTKIGVGWAEPGLYTPSESKTSTTTVVFVDRILEDVKQLFASVGKEKTEKEPVTA